MNTVSNKKMVLSLVVEFGAACGAGAVDAWPTLLIGLARLLRADGYIVIFSPAAGLKDLAQRTEWGLALTSGRRNRLMKSSDGGRPGTVVNMRKEAAGGPAIAVFEADRVIIFYRRASGESFGHAPITVVSSVVGACYAVSTRRAAMELPPSLQGISTRLRTILAGLLLGHSEKEMANKLGLSRHTVHKYSKSLYRQARVYSRGELLSLCFRFDRERSIQGIGITDSLLREYGQIPNGDIQGRGNDIPSTNPVSPVDGSNSDVVVSPLKSSQQFRRPRHSLNKFVPRHRDLYHGGRLRGLDACG